MYRRDFLIRWIATPIGASFGAGLKSVDVCRREDSFAILMQHQQTAALREIESMEREIIARYRQLELARRSLTAELERRGLISRQRLRERNRVENRTCDGPE